MKLKPSEYNVNCGQCGNNQMKVLDSEEYIHNNEIVYMKRLQCCSMLCVGPGSRFYSWFNFNGEYLEEEEEYND